MKTVFTGGDVGALVVADGEVVAPFEDGERGLVEAAIGIDSEFVTDFLHPHFGSIKSTTQHGDMAVFPTLRGKVNGQQDVAVWQVNSLHTTCA